MPSNPGAILRGAGQCTQRPGATRVQASRLCALLAVGFALAAPATSPAAAPQTAQERMNQDLMEVTIPQLQRYDAEHKYTVAARVLNLRTARWLSRRR